jgi:hypothetical protein
VAALVFAISICLNVAAQPQNEGRLQAPGAGATPGAESSFVGTWKLNPRLSQTVMTFEPVPPDMIRYSIGGSNLRFTFGPDETHKLLDSLGKGLVTGKQIDSSTWGMTTYTRQGETRGTDTWKVSPDGHTLTTTETTPMGQVTIVSERVTGTSGIFGTWKWRLGDISYPDQFQIQPFGDGGLALISIEYAATCQAKFDGKDHTCTGSAVPDGMTIALNQTEPRTLEATAKRNGKVLFRDKYILAPNGRFFLNESRPGDSSTPLAWVYDRH